VVWLGWRFGYVTISLFGPLALIAVYFLLASKPADIGLGAERAFAVSRPGGAPARPRESQPPFWRLIRNRNLILVAASQFFVFGNYFGMVNWLPTYFAEVVALSEVEAGFQTGFILWGTIIGYALSGPVSNLLGRCTPLYAGGAAVAAVLTVIFATGSLTALPVWSWPALMVVYGLSVSIMVLMLPIVASFVPVASLATANGFALTFGYLGAMASPAVIGIVADLTGSLTDSFWVAVASATLGFCFASFIREGSTGTTSA
jgi:MFS transporter, ACS family, hexuronate transporter